MTDAYLAAPASLSRRAALLGGISVFALSGSALACSGGPLSSSSIERWAERNPVKAALLVGGLLLALGVGLAGFAGAAAVASAAGFAVFVAGIGIGVVGLALVVAGAGRMLDIAARYLGVPIESVRSSLQNAENATDVKEGSAEDFESAAS